MILQEIIMADCTAIVLIVILSISRYLTRRKKVLEDKFFTALVIFGLLGAICELVAFLIDGKPGVFLNILNISLNFIIYTCTTTISLLWIWYVDSNLNHNPKRIKTIFLPFVIVWAILIVMLIVNIFTGFLYTIDANNVYGRRPLGYIYYAFLFISFLTSIIVYLRYRIIHGRTQVFPIWMFLLPVILACTIQALWYGIAAAWLGCGIGLVSIYLNIQARFSSIDGLTGLYNRSFIDHELIVARKKSTRYVYGGLMIDMDYFKQINDNYGHSIGDQALRQVAKILVDATNRDTLVFRFAGDEFVILLRLPIVQKDELLSKMSELKSRIYEKAQLFNNSEEVPYKIRFSIGHAIYDTKRNDDDFFKNMDAEMYLEKNKHHKFDK